MAGGELVLVFGLQAVVGVAGQIPLDVLLVDQKEALAEFLGLPLQHGLAPPSGLLLSPGEVLVDVPVEGCHFGRDRYLHQVLLQRRVGFVGPVALLPAVVAVIVPVAPAIAFGRAAGEQAPAGGADEVPAQHEFGNELALGPGGLSRGEALLHLVEECLADDGLVQAVEHLFRLVTPCRQHDLAGVDGVAQDLREPVAAALEALTHQAPADLLHRETRVPGRHLEGFRDERGGRARNDGRPVALVPCVLVADGRHIAVTPFPDGAARAGLCGKAPPPVLDLGGRHVEGEHHELLGHAAVDRLLDGLHLDAQPFHGADHLERARRVAAEAVPFDDEERVSGAGVGPHERQELLKRRALERLGAVVVLVVGYGCDAAPPAVVPQAGFLVA